MVENKRSHDADAELFRYGVDREIKLLKTTSSVYERVNYRRVRIGGESKIGRDG